MTSSTGDRAIKVSLGLSLIIMGLAACAWLWFTYAKSQETRHWTPVEALVISSELLTDRKTPNSPLSYQAEIHYRYVVDGQTYTGTRLGAGGPTNKPDRARENVAKFATGRIVTCYVNPADPKVAILKHASQAGLYSMFFPLLFVVGGAGMILSVMFIKKS